MPTFEMLQNDGDLKEILKTAFDSDLPVNGSWGYTQELVTSIEPSDIPTLQLEHIFASMRAYVEMNMTKEPQDRYGSINVNEISREVLTLKDNIFHKVSYEITAMKEDIYANFIKEYKENYGKNDFDLTKHFEERKRETLRREVLHWFKI